MLRTMSAIFGILVILTLMAVTYQAQQQLLVLPF